MINSYNLKENRVINSYNLFHIFIPHWGGGGGGYIALQVCPNKTCPIDN